MIIWRNGDWLAEADAAIAADDRGFLLGDGLFETVRVRVGAPVRLAAHYERLARSCEALGLDLDWSETELEAAIQELCRRRHLDAAVVRVTLTAGSGPRGLVRGPATATSLIIAAHVLTPPPAGVSMARTDFGRAPGAPSTAHKTLNYGDNIQARRQAVAANADMALICDTQGRLSGADCANLFWLEASRLKTPALNCAVLPGTARAAVLSALGGDEVEAGPEVLARAEAVFVTNALWPGVPVTQLDGQAVPQDPGLLARVRDCLE